MDEEKSEEGSKHPTKDADAHYDVHPNGQFVGFADILLTCPAGTTVVGEALLVSVTLITDVLLLDANFLCGVAIVSDSAVVTGNDVDVLIVGAIRDVSGVFNHARQTECDISPHALEVEADSPIRIETMT